MLPSTSGLSQMREAAVPNDSWKGRYQLPKRTVWFLNVLPGRGVTREDFFCSAETFLSLVQKLCVELWITYPWEAICAQMHKRMFFMKKYILAAIWWSCLA